MRSVGPCGGHGLNPTVTRRVLLSERSNGNEATTQGSMKKNRLPMHKKLKMEVVVAMHKSIEAEAAEFFIPEKEGREWHISLQPIRPTRIKFTGRTAKAQSAFFAEQFREVYVSAVRDERERAMAAVLSHGG